MMSVKRKNRWNRLREIDTGTESKAVEKQDKNGYNNVLIEIPMKETGKQSVRK